jgi:NAD+ kinase
MRVGFVGQRGNDTAVSLVSEIADRLRADGVEAVVDEATRAALDRDGSEDAPEAVPVDALAGCDLAVSVGGDGTFLYAARGAGTTPIMGVNLGEVGFLNAVSPDEAVEAVGEEVRHVRETGSARTTALPRLEASADGWTTPPALNEVVVQGPSRGHGNAIGVEVRIDGSLYTVGRADGVLIATATGSTAYNLSEGGPLIHPGVPGVAVTEMCGEDAMPPLVTGVDATVTVEVEDADRAVAVADGRHREPLDPPATVRIERAGTPIHIAGPPLDFFAALGKLE